MTQCSDRKHLPYRHLFDLELPRPVSLTQYSGYVESYRSISRRDKCLLANNATPSHSILGHGRIKLVQRCGRRERERQSLCLNRSCTIEEVVECWRMETIRRLRGFRQLLHRRAGWCVYEDVFEGDSDTQG